MLIPDRFTNLSHIFKQEQTLAQEKTIVLDYSGVTFISPLGMIWSLLITEKLDKEQKEYQIIAPLARVPVSYMERLDFFKYANQVWLDAINSVHDLGALRSRNRNSTEESLVELRRVETPKSLHEISGAVNSVLKAHSRSQANRVNLIVSELTGNILDHSGSHGYVAVQHYPTKGHLQIALGDCGIGVVESLKGIVRGSAKRIIEKAFENQVSSLRQEGRGFGLGRVRSRTVYDIRHYEFGMLTNGSVYDIGEKRVSARQVGKYISYGTFFEIGLWG